MAKNRPRLPENGEALQNLVDMSHGFLLLDSARKYGLVTGGPGVNVERCVEIIEHGEARGIKPRPDAAERMLAAIADGGLGTHER
jgi:hypothetical protein